MVARPEDANGSKVAFSEYLRSSGDVHLGDVHVAHGPVTEATLGDLLVHQEAHLRVTRVLHDVAVELADRVAAALQHLDEDIVAHAEHAGDADFWLLRRDCSRIESMTAGVRGAAARLA
jgi:hypothetical protein